MKELVAFLVKPNRRKTVFWILLTLYLLALTAAFARMRDYSSHIIGTIASNTDLTICLLVLTYGYFLVHTFRKPTRKDVPTVVASVLFGLLWQFGSALVQIKSITPLFNTGCSAVVTVSTIIVLSVFVYTLLTPCFDRIIRNGCGHSQNGGVLSCDISDWGTAWKAVFTFAPLAMAICWLPIIIVQLPGSVSPDMARELNQFYGYSIWSAHHPLAASLVYGVLFSMGDAMAGVDGGVLAVTLVQTALYALALSFELRVMKVLGATKRGIGAGLAFFALFPIFAAFAQWVNKDSMFGVAFVLYASLLALYAKEPTAFSRSRGHMAMLLATAFAVGMLRYNGFYVVLLSLPLLSMLHEGVSRRLRALVPMALVIVLVPMANIGLQAALSATPGSAREALSIPFQQTARYVADHSEDVEEWERAAIDGVLDYEAISEKYTWYISDPVKNTFKENGSLSEYFRAWASQGLKHPMCYANALLLQTYAYWYPTLIDDYKQELWGFGKTDNEHFNWGKWFPSELRLAAYNTLNALKAVPFIGYLLCMGTYAWIIIAAVFLLIRSGHGRYVICFLPCIVLLLTCIAGPLNGSMRYGVGVVATMPLVVGLAICGARGFLDGFEGGPRSLTDDMAQNVSQRLEA